MAGGPKERGTGVDVDGGRLEFRTTRSQARKYLSRGAKDEQASSLSNNSHLEGLVGDMNSLVTMVSHVAADARSRLAAARAGATATATNVADEVGRLVDAASPTTTAPGTVARDLVSRGSSLVFSEPDNSARKNVNNDLVPFIDRVTVDIDRKKGSVDCFFSRLTFSLPTSLLSTVSAVRILRSTVDRAAFGVEQGRLSMHGVDRIRSQNIRSRSKGDMTLGLMEQTLRENMVDNSLNSLIPVDQFLNRRVGAQLEGSGDVDTSSPVGGSVGAERKRLDISSFLFPEGLMGLDSSVVNDPNSLRNLQTSNPNISTVKLNDSVRARPGSTSDGLVVDKNNVQEFKEVGFFSPDRLRAGQEGDRAVFVFDDTTVSYGKVYRYYLVSVDTTLRESMRSRIVEVSIDGLRVPESPRDVSARHLKNIVTLTVQVDDQLVEKFEVYRRSESVSVSDTAETDAVSVSTEQGFSLEGVASVEMKNSISMVGESLNAISKGGSVFYDRNVIPGRKYTYRVYSVDVFGNKSESPKEVEIFISDKEHRLTDLKKPHIVVEVDATTNRNRLTFGTDDSRVVALFVSRRNVTIGQKAFVSPNETNSLVFGQAPAAGSGRFVGPVISDKLRDGSWSGYFQNTGELQVFVDNHVNFDNAYQYMVYGLDRFGNRTPVDVSRPVMNIGRPFLNSPLDLKVSLVTGSDDGAVLGAALSWKNGNVDITSEDRVGDQDVLSATAVRTLYQVERRRVGEEIWREFPMVEDTSMVDPVVGTSGSAGNFRPPYLEFNSTYEYRVQLYQTGSYISNLSLPVSVFVSSPPLRPLDFVILSSDAKLRPFFLMLNWNTGKLSGEVDRWEIERAAVNNLAASNLDVRDPEQVKRLDFRNFRTVYRESSRFRSFTKDSSLSMRNNPAIVGDHHFMDTDVVFGNTYYYRIRSVGVDGRRSGWTLKGAKLVDDAPQNVGGDTRSSLSRTLVAVVPPTRPENSMTSFGLVSRFASPDRQSVVSAAETSTSSVFSRTRRFSGK